LSDCIIENVKYKPRYRHTVMPCITNVAFPKHSIVCLSREQWVLVNEKEIY